MTSRLPTWQYTAHIRGIPRKSSRLLQVMHNSTRAIHKYLRAAPASARECSTPAAARSCATVRCLYRRRGPLTARACDRAVRQPFSAAPEGTWGQGGSIRQSQHSQRRNQSRRK